ncbi:MAG: DoxX family membrane protein [Marinifilaceae bacterium]|nr:DoxX family membrane protein [Marinifilaceae bacterium]
MKKIIKTISRILLGIFLIYAGISHLSFNRTEFLAQVPSWLFIEADLVVVLSGYVEIVLGLLMLVFNKKRMYVGWIVGLFFVIIFPGNIHQYVNHIDSFGLNTDTARGIRLLFQPVLIIWAIWSTDAWSLRKKTKYFTE